MVVRDLDRNLDLEVYTVVHELSKKWHNQWLDGSVQVQ